MSKEQQQTDKTVSDEELLAVMADFLEMGHVENIVAMYKQEPRYYQWTGKLLTDERFVVRLGISVLFEYLVEQRPAEVRLAIPSLRKQLENPDSLIRGEAVNVLGIIGTPDALALVEKMVQDPDSQVVEVARDILKEAYPERTDP
ncbi:MAG TPA: HEAT repeat domain-containing protein [Desulfobulbus sp.]|nr:HEAT repeat domain-containing protein [Desulfobulbus sp.]